MNMETLTKTKWAIDPTHSEIGFKVKHMMISTVRGNFNHFEADVYAEKEDFSDAQVAVQIKTDSIQTNNQDRDNHLKSDDFFNAADYPYITFKSTELNAGKLKGELSIRDVTKEVELDVEFHGAAIDPYGQHKAGFEITGEINRKEFGLQWNAITEAGNVVVSDKIKLVIDAQFVRQD